ncbi:FkbM family methyltransferase [Synechococcus sp. ATX 2A4]|uniref:FkbM family methyltransferase n=1 Tax=Synechococcus sp. ATX 2A4 TaxID=2823727 RepID=UPI0020CD5A03|nr:FkbM family methyltransferase [Synechococcus sp. ATX 2A4]MCP9885395.1 FkbM family methyltransferase [Synechococcus sp. ATX 2A4]
MTRQESTDWLHGSINTYGAGDLISDCLVAYGEWARTEVEFICNHLLPPQGTFIDVGAFIGTHSIPFALHVGNGGKGIAFEPNSPSFSLLTANLQKAGLQNVTAYNMAASHSSGIAFSLFSDPVNLGHTALHQVINTSTPANGEQSFCLGQAIDDLHLDHVDLIKVDAEGMERSVLSGCLGLIKNCKPNIFLELNSLEEHAFVFELAKTFNYAVHGVRTLAFSPSNHKHNLINDLLGGGAELGIVLSTQSLPRIGSAPEDALIVQPLKDLDELGIFLLSKPQYRSKLLTGALPEFLGTTDYLSTSSTFLETQALTDRSHRLDAERIQAVESASQLTEELNRTRESAGLLTEELSRIRENASLLKEKLSKALEDARQAQNEMRMAQSIEKDTARMLAEVRAELEDLAHISGQQLLELNEIRSSRSWALTSPYRKIATLIRGLIR